MFKLLVVATVLLIFKGTSAKTCSSGYKCKTGSKCLTSLDLCDGIVDCSDSSDEQNCTSIWTISSTTNTQSTSTTFVTVYFWTSVLRFIVNNRYLFILLFAGIVGGTGSIGARIFRGRARRRMATGGIMVGGGQPPLFGQPPPNAFQTGQGGQFGPMGGGHQPPPVYSPNPLASANYPRMAAPMITPNISEPVELKVAPEKA